MSTQGGVTLQKTVSRVEVTNAFLRSVYNWMALGLGLTALISCAFTYYAPLTYYLLTPTGQMIGMGSIIAELIIVFYMSFRINKISGTTATTMFLVYSALNGISLSFVLLAYTASSVAQAFITATGMFAGMSLYGLFTKRDLSGLGGLFSMGLIGLVIAMIVNIFMQSSMLELGISLFGVVLFLGLTAYDTQFLKEMGESVPQNDAVAVRRATIMGALKLYLDFINLFLMLLRLLGNRE